MEIIKWTVLLKLILVATLTIVFNDYQYNKKRNRKTWMFEPGANCDLPNMKIIYQDSLINYDLSIGSKPLSITIPKQE